MFVEFEKDCNYKKLRPFDKHAVKNCVSYLRGNNFSGVGFVGSINNESKNYNDIDLIVSTSDFKNITNVVDELREKMKVTHKGTTFYAVEDKDHPLYMGTEPTYLFRIKTAKGVNIHLGFLYLQKPQQDTPKMALHNLTNLLDRFSQE